MLQTLPGNSADKRLRKIFSELSKTDREALLAFAEFLHSRSVPAAADLTLQEIVRPAEESVVAAIKRLSATYPMLDKALLLNETSSLMTQHIMQGRARVEVIDELEVVFRRHYHSLTKDTP